MSRYAVCLHLYCFCPQITLIFTNIFYVFIREIRGNSISSQAPLEAVLGIFDRETKLGQGIANLIACAPILVALSL